MNNDFDSRRGRRKTRVGVMLNAVKQCECNKKPANPKGCQLDAGEGVGGGNAIWKLKTFRGGLERPPTLLAV